MSPDHGEVTRVLDALGRGEGHASRDLLPLIYDELRRQAARRLDRLPPGQTLGPTALVHEAYLRLVGGEGADTRPWENRGHFYASAAEAMRRILIDRARDKGRLKRGGDRLRSAMDLASVASADGSPDDLMDLDEALKRLEVVDPGAAALVKLRVFAGLTLGDAAAALGIARRTADRDWAFARAWLFRVLGKARPDEE